MKVDDLSNSWDVLVLDDLDEGLLQKTSEFLQSCLPGEADRTWSPEYLRWKLEKNPAGRGFLTCAVSNGNVVGVTSITLKKMWYKDQTVNAGEIGDTFTHPLFLKRGKMIGQKSRIVDQASGTKSKADYYNRSIFGRLVKETRERAENSGIHIIYGTPNEKSLAGYEKRLNFKVHSLDTIQAFKRPTAKGICSLYGIPRPFHFPVRFIEKIAGSILYLYWRMKSSIYGYSFARVDKPTDEFDHLWDELKHQYKFSIIHNKEYFQHRFFDHPLGSYNVYKISHKGKICGVIVVRIFDDFKGRKCCSLADWIYDESKSDLFPVMIAHAIHDNQQDALFYYSSWCPQNTSQTNALLKQGFPPRQKCPVIFFQNEEGSNIIKNCSPLNITIASTDNI